MKNITKWKAVYLNVKWKPKSSLQIKEFGFELFDSKEAALGHAYNFKNCSYVKKLERGVGFICWDGNPSYGYCNYRHVIIVPDNNTGFLISSKDGNLKQRLQEMFDDWFSNEKSYDKIYQDDSIRLSNLSWQTTIPKGWKLLPVGSIIKDTDKEFGDSTYGPNFWGMVNWYNEGKKVKREQGMSWSKLVNGKQVIYKTTKGTNSPLIIRKIS